MRKCLGVLLVLIVAMELRADDFATRMLVATFKIYNQDSTATGFFVKPPEGVAAEPHQLLLVTANHVFDKMKGDEAIIVLRTPQDDGTWARRDFTFKVRDGKKALWTKNPGHDVAVMRVTLPEDVLVTPIEFNQLADEKALKGTKLHIGSDLLVLGFPMRVESSPAGFPIARHASIASYPLYPVKPNKTFMAEFTTFAGDSGAPVFVPQPTDGEKPEDTRPLVLGIVLAQHFADEKLNMYYEERMIHHPLNMSTILHAHFVREVIDQLKK